MFINPNSNPNWRIWWDDILWFGWKIVYWPMENEQAISSEFERIWKKKQMVVLKNLKEQEEETDGCIEEKTKKQKQ